MNWVDRKTRGRVRSGPRNAYQRVLYGSWAGARRFPVIPVEVSTIGWKTHKGQKGKTGGLGETQLFLTLMCEKGDSADCQLIGFNVSS